MTRMRPVGWQYVESGFSRILILPIALVLALATIGCGTPTREPEPGTGDATGEVTGPERVDEERLAMGSILRLTAWTDDEPRARQAFDAVFKEFDRLDLLLSVWKPESDVVRLNAAAGERPVAVSAETLEVLRIAREVSELTSGTFDVTFGALSDVWKFDHDQDDSVPTAEQIRARLPLVGYKAIVLDGQARTAFLQKKGMRVHLGGIGKGYAVDRGVAILRRTGLRDFMIQAGGDLYVAGQRGGRPWRLGLADPRNADGPSFATIELRDQTFSTSGDYERSFIRDGVRYHHILDLTTGQPARLSRSVTLVTSRAVIADALAKGVFILGPQKGMALIESLPEVEGVIVSAENDVLISSGLEGRLSVVHMPTDGL
jgi:thiamine biosynthesis lipoprotein